MSAFGGRTLAAECGIREDSFMRPRFTNFCYFLEWERRGEGYAFNVHPSEYYNDERRAFF
jgi:hypothetical protein